ncbi:MAG: hypothetical protein Q8Q28_00240 [Pseudomonadota bacterium]|nr:hypothetical protein [Pseudomonadota bacterium]
MLIRPVIILALLAGLSGCSSLHVDVDVYKGPLINERAVQVEQMASLALGVKPLLETTLIAIEDMEGDSVKLDPYIGQAAISLGGLLSFYEDEEAINKINEKRAFLSTQVTNNLVSHIIAANEGINALSSKALWAVRFTQSDMARSLVALYHECAEVKDIDKRKYCTETRVGDRVLYVPDRNKIERALRKYDTAELLKVLSGKSKDFAISNDIKIRFSTQLPVRVNLETVIAAFRSDKENAKLNEKLTDTLIDFAERARTLGNQALLFLPLLPNDAPMTAESTGVSTRAAQAERMRRGIETLAPVLQTVGNTILSQANEIVRYGRIDDREGDLKTREENVWRGVMLRAVGAGVLADVKAIPDEQWSDKEFRASLETLLQDADSQSARIKFQLKEKVANYRLAAEDLPALRSAVGILEKKKDECGKKDGGPAMTDGLQDCLGKESGEWKTASRLLSAELAKEKQFNPARAREIFDQRAKELTRKKENADRFENWLARLDDAIGIVPPTFDAKNRREVMDGLMSALRQAQVQALLAGEKTKADRIVEAYKVVEAHRAGMITLLPASSYLRNSHPTTSLQQGTNQNSRYNMLWDSFLQGFPNLAGKSDDERLLAHQDKQYWVQVNSVHLSGAGKTNQVLVKDDVGNWYVKSFSEDKEQIFQSMKKLALFNMRGNLGALRQARARLVADGKELDVGTVKLKDLISGQSDPSAGTAAAVYKVVLRRYAEKTLAEYRKLLCMDDGQENTAVKKSLYQCKDYKLTPRWAAGTPMPEPLTDYRLGQKPITTPSDILDFTLRGLEQDLLDTLPKVVATTTQSADKAKVDADKSKAEADKSKAEADKAKADKDDAYKDKADKAKADAMNVKDKYEMALNSLLSDLDTIGQTLSDPLPQIGAN